MVDPPVRAVSIELNDARFDLPEFSGQGTDYIICSTPRSGSTLLGFLLRECGMMGVPHEYLHPNVHLPALARRCQPVAPDGSVDFDAYFGWLRRRRSTANGVFGLKTHWRHVAPLLHISPVARWIEGALLIRMRRRDVIRQAISYYVAEETGVWSVVDASAAAAIPAPEYDGPLIEKYLLMLLEEDAGWSRFLSGKKLSALEVWYEDLIAAPDPVCRSVCRHVGVDVPFAFAFDLAAVSLKRLSSPHAEDWKRRFSAEHEALLQTLPPALMSSR
jgi:LPS sulfotransferase NodH